MTYRGVGVKTKFSSFATTDVDRTSCIRLAKHTKRKECNKHTHTVFVEPRVTCLSFFALHHIYKKLGSKAAALTCVVSLFLYAARNTNCPCSPRAELPFDNRWKEAFRIAFLSASAFRNENFGSTETLESGLLSMRRRSRVLAQKWV